MSALVECSTRRGAGPCARDSLGLFAIGQLLWAAQGVRDAAGLRAAPSAGAPYPLEIYTVTASGVFHDEAKSHSLVRVLQADVRPALAAAASERIDLEDAVQEFSQAPSERPERRPGRTVSPP